MSFRDLDIQLLSPAGESSTLSPSAAVVPTTFISVFGFDGSHRFGSAKHLGEDAQGTWQLRLTDRHPEDTGTLRSWRIKAYGHGYVPGYAEIGQVTSGPGSLAVTWTAPTDTGRAGSAITSYDLRYIPRRRHRLRRRQLDRGHRDRQRRRPRPHREQAGRRGEVPGPGPRRQRRRQRPLVRCRRPEDAAGTARRSPERSSPHLATKPSPSPGGSRPTSAPATRRRTTCATSAATPSTRPTTSGTPSRTPGRRPTASCGYVIPSLDNGVQYDVQLLARNSAGESGWSAVAKGTPANINGPADFPSTEDGPAQRAREHRGRRGHRRAGRGP